VLLLVLTHPCGWHYNHPVLLVLLPLHSLGSSSGIGRNSSGRSEVLEESDVG
jgi:hypothetical protein